MPLSVFQNLPTDTHTWYSAPNNDPPGYDSYPHAKGTGTYANPVTFAIADDSKTFSQGTIIYIPELEKYFFAEDTCAACADDLAQGHQDHIDLWVGDLSSDCADNIHVPATMYSQSSDPEPIHYLIVSSSDTADQNYTVNQAPFTCGNS
jgi:3D (Asp-Asp-Asp) domain-containing protein